MISPQQYRKLMKHYRLKNNISQSAIKAGIDRKTASKYVQGAPSPKEEASPRYWRTHRDAFDEVWAGIEEALFREPRLQAKVLFEQLLEQEPGKFSRRQRRSFDGSGPGSGVMERNRSSFSARNISLGSDSNWIGCTAMVWRSTLEANALSICWCTLYYPIPTGSGPGFVTARVTCR